MAKSQQHLLPRARVNITLDVETGGARENKELPLKLLVLGDFSKEHDRVPLEEREKVRIDKENFNQVINNFSPQLSLQVNNVIDSTADTLDTTLQFKTIKDFEPDHIAEQIPALKQLVAMRNLLKDLRSQALDNKQLKNILQQLVRDEDKQEYLLADLRKHAPLA